MRESRQRGPQRTEAHPNVARNWRECTVTGLTGVEQSYDATGRATVVETASTFLSSEYDVTVSISAFGDFPSFFAFAHIEVWGDGPVPCEAYTSGNPSGAVCPGMFSRDGTFTVIVVAES